MLGWTTRAAVEEFVEEVGEATRHSEDSIECSSALYMRRAMLGVRSISESELMILIEYKKSWSIVQRKLMGTVGWFISTEKTRVTKSPICTALIMTADV